MKKTLSDADILSIQCKHQPWESSTLPAFARAIEAHILARLAAEQGGADQAAEPAGWALQKPDGSIEFDLIGTKADCEYWASAEGESQYGWAVVPIFLATPAPTPRVKS